MTRTFVALVLSASAAASAMPTAVEHGVVVQGGLQFQKTIVLDQTLRTEGGDTLLRGSYEVRFESLPGNKVRTTFFQGGVKRGEAQGIIIGGTPASFGFSSRLMENEGLYYYFRHDDGKHQLVVGQQGATQIQISLLPPGATTGVTPTPQPRFTLTLARPMLADGQVKLEPGDYDVAFRPAPAGMPHFVAVFSRGGVPVATAPAELKGATTGFKLSNVDVNAWIRGAIDHSDARRDGTVHPAKFHMEAPSERAFFEALLTEIYVPPKHGPSEAPATVTLAPLRPAPTKTPAKK